eukprot:11940096-Alexandrium_andersonii.AAC.1
MASSWDATIAATLPNMGGWKQRSTAAPRDAPRGGDRSALAERLLQLVGWGLISSATAQWLAAGAVEDGLVGKTAVTKLANIGHGGEYPGNARRDLLKAFCSSMWVPSPLTLTLPVMLKDKKERLSPISMLSPVEVVETIFEQHPNMFPEFFGDNLAE